MRSTGSFEARKIAEMKLMPDIISSTYDGLSCHYFDVELLATEPRTSGRHDNELGFRHARTFSRRSTFAPLHSTTVSEMALSRRQDGPEFRMAWFVRILLRC
jgi:hypothetical protein